MLEIDHFEEWCTSQGLPIRRPNSMNEHGAILDEMGFAPLMREWIRYAVEPLSRVCFPEVLLEESHLDDHHAFVVEYGAGKDRTLSEHVDDAEVTLNLCLGRVFTGSKLLFNGIRCGHHRQCEARTDELITTDHTLGSALLHLGNHRHRALPLESGHRSNLILWCRSRVYRERIYAQLEDMDERDVQPSDCLIPCDYV